MGKSEALRFLEEDDLISVVEEGGESSEQELYPFDDPDQSRDEKDQWFKEPRTAGGPGSGNFGHAGRPGEVGGSAAWDAGGAQPTRAWTTEDGFASRMRDAEFNPDQARDEKGQWTTGGGAPDLGEHDMPVFDEADEHSSEWRAILKHDDFLDKLDEGAHDDENYRKMNDAIDQYVHKPDLVNNALRANPDLMDEDPEDNVQGEWSFKSRDASIAETARELENAMADAPKIKDPVVVYRGLRGVTAEQIAASPRITLNGFQSTSFDPRVAASFMGEKAGGLATGSNLDGVLLRITAKYGLALGHAHSIDGEMEMLLPHGDSYKVLGVGRVRYQGGVYPVVHLEQGG